MGFGGHVERADTFDHLGGEPVGGGSLQTVLHAGVAQGLDVHVSEGGRAAGHHHGDVHMRGVHALDEADRPEQLLEGFGFVVGQGVDGFGDEHALAHSHRSVRNGALDMDVRRVNGFAVFGGEQVLVLLEIPAGGDGDDDLARLSKFVGQRLDNGGNLVGLDGDDDHVSGRHHFQRIVQRAHAKFGGGLLKLVVVGSTSDHLAAGDHARVNEALAMAWAMLPYPINRW